MKEKKGVQTKKSSFTTQKSVADKTLKMEEEKKFTIGKINLMLIAASFLIIVLGFFLMAGAPTDVDFNPDIFSTRRIVVGPMISFFGFLSMAFSILYKPKTKEKE